MELSSLLLQSGSDWSVCDSGESPALPGSCSAPDRGPLGLCKGPSVFRSPELSVTAQENEAVTI